MPMTVKDYVSGSCAGGEIISLSTHKDARDAMIFFCKQVLGMPGGPQSGFYRSKTQPKFNCTASHYVFIAGPEAVSDGPRPRVWPNYGTDFAQYIIDNKFGLVATLPKTKNRKYHPETTCQIWIWQPDQAALETWWGNEIKVEQEAEARIAAEKKANQERLMAELRAKLGANAQFIKVEHHNAQPSSPVIDPKPLPTGSYSALGRTVSFCEVSSYNRYLYHNTYNGTKNYTVCVAGFDLPKINTTYKIYEEDARFWTIAEEPQPKKVKK